MLKMHPYFIKFAEPEQIPDSGVEDSVQSPKQPKPETSPALPETAQTAQPKAETGSGAGSAVQSPAQPKPETVPLAPTSTSLAAESEAPNMWQTVKPLLPYIALGGLLGGGAGGIAGDFRLKNILGGLLLGAALGGGAGYLLNWNRKKPGEQAGEPQQPTGPTPAEPTPTGPTPAEPTPTEPTPTAEAETKQETKTVLPSDAEINKERRPQSE